MQPFDYLVPRDREEASAWLSAGNGAVRPLQGGTDLIVRARGGFVRPDTVVDLKGLPGMREVRELPDGTTVIGAACTMNQVAEHPRIKRAYDLLAQAAWSVASYQIRNRATIGGNCCNASPAADTAPALYCLDAQVEIYGPRGVRCLPIDEFFVGPGRTALAAGEFVTALLLPSPVLGSRGAYLKLGRTRVGDIATVSVAVLAHPAATPSGLSWRVALGAVGPTPLRAPAAETALNVACTPAEVAAAAQLAGAAAHPIGDIRASADYRRAMVAVLVRRCVAAVLAAAAEGGAA